MFFRRGCTRLLSTSTPINHIVFFLQNTSCIRKQQVISGGGVCTPCTLPLDPPLQENAKAFKNRLKKWIYTCRSLWVTGRRDSTLFGVVDDTTRTKFTGRACAVQCNSLPVVVDQAVVVVLKFPNNSWHTQTGGGCA